MDPLQIYLFLALLAAATAGGVGLFAWRRMRAAQAIWQSQMERATRLQGRLESIEAFLASDSGMLFVWSGGGSLRAFADGAVHTQNQAETLFTAFHGALNADSQAELTAAVNALQENGTAFAFPLFCKDERTLACRGRPAGTGTVLSVSDVSEAFQEICVLRDALTETLEERDFLRHTFDEIPYPSWRRDANGRLVWVNKAYCRAVEAPSMESVVSRGDELFERRELAAAGPPMHLHRMRTVIAGQRRILDLFEIINTNGAVGIAVDVTEIDDAHDEVRKQLAAQRSSLNLLHTPVAIFSADRNLEFFNQSFADLWNLSADWLSNAPDHSEVLEAMRTSRRLPEQADFPAWKKKQLGYYSDLIDSQEEIWQLPNEKTLRVVTQARPQGGLFILYEDLTELLSLERSLNALSKVQLETLNSLQEGVAVFGVDGRLSLFNPSLLRIWKLTEADLENHLHIEQMTHLYQALVPQMEGWNEIKMQIAGMRASREASLMRIHRVDNSVLDCVVRPLPDGGTMLSFADVTDSVQMEQTLRERNEALETTDRLKSEFITHISYQFRTPLNSVIGFAEILEHEFFGPLNERQHEYSQGLLEASHHLLTLVNDVIDLATIEAGYMALSRSQIDIRGLLLSVRELSRQRARESDMTLVLDCPEDIGVFYADARRVKQVMFNLMSNAIRFSSAGDEIIIGANYSTNEDGRKILQLWVRDKGIGIDSAFQQDMFKAFESRPARGKEQGVGIGLSIVRSLIGLHDGWVDVESELNRGTKVTCNLPLYTPEDGEEPSFNQPPETQAIRAHL